MTHWDILAPVQLLWINLDTDTFPAIALGDTPTQPGIILQKPRGRLSNFFSGGVGPADIWQGILTGLLLLGVYWIAITYPVTSGTAANTADAYTLAYATTHYIQLFTAFNVKSITQSLFTVGHFRLKDFNWAILDSFLLLADTILVPGFNGLFTVTTLHWTQWITVLGAGDTNIDIVEIVLVFTRARRRRLAK